MYTDTGNTCKYVVIVIDLCFVLVRPCYFKTWRHWILGALLQAFSHAQSSDVWQSEMVYARQWVKAIHFNPCCVPQSNWKNGTPAYIRYDTIYNLWLADAGSVSERQRVFVMKFWQQAPGTRKKGHAGYAFLAFLSKWWRSLPVFTHAVWSHCSDINPQMVLESGYLTRRCWLKLRVITKLTHVEKKTYYIILFSYI